MKAAWWWAAAAPEGGYFVPPTIIADVDSKARIFQEEIFGPVLAVTKSENFEHGLELANDTQYGLTGAVFSNDPQHLKDAKERFHVGNLYLNRKCTGAMVGAHPSVASISGYGFESRRPRLSIAFPTSEVGSNQALAAVRRKLAARGRVCSSLPRGRQAGVFPALSLRGKIPREL